MNYDFIEIGTSNFDTLLEKYNDKVGLSVEPIKQYLDLLPDKKLVIKANYALGACNGIVDTYWVDPLDIKKHQLPDWLRGCNSVIEKHPSTTIVLKERGLEHLLKKTKCMLITWETLVSIYDIKSVDYLKIDTEGHDCIILDNILTSNFYVKPQRITFENNSLSNSQQVKKTLELLHSFDYKILEEKGDNITVQLENV